MNSPELTFNFLINTVHSIVNSIKFCYMQLASSGNPAGSDKKYSKVLLKVGKKVERHYQEVLFQICEHDGFICWI